MVGAFCAPFNAKRTQHKADEETAAVAQENGRGIEVEAQESEDRAGEGDRHHRDQRRPIEKSHDKGDQSREQG